MPPNRTQLYDSAPYQELLSVLLRQYRRPLLTRGVPLSDADADRIAASIAEGQPPDERQQVIMGALRDSVAESEGVLQGWGLTFEQSLDAAMTDIPGWESTAEFLTLAEQKANAELRISTGSALLVAMGDKTYAGHVITLVERESRGTEIDLDTVIARRALISRSGVDPRQPDWLDQARVWAASNA